MRRTTTFLAVLAMALTAFAPSPSGTDDGASCRLDGAVVHTGAVATASCVDADGGSFEVAYVVTVQELRSEGWADIATERCTGSSTEGVAVVDCEAVGPPGSTGSVRALLDLELPNDLPPAELRPTDQGDGHEDAVVDDECGVNEAIDTHDLTAPDAPWADICSVTMAHDLAGGSLASVAVTLHVAGMLDVRPPTTSWEVLLHTENCVHLVEGWDAGVTGTAGGRVHSECNPLPFEPCGGINGIIYGDACQSFPGYADEESIALSAEALSFTDTEVRISFSTAGLGPNAAADLVAGRTVDDVDARASTIVGNPGQGPAVLVDADFASSNGRSYRFS